MLEIINLDLPYPKERAAFASSRMTGMDMQLLRNISKGIVAPELLESRKEELQGTKYEEIFRGACTLDPAKRLTANE